MYYAGVGSRETPLHICELMTQIAKKLSSLGWVCRSGGAEGADLAFMRGAARLENYIAWLGAGSGEYSGIVPNLERNFEYLRDVENLNPLLYDPRTMQNPKYRGMWKLHARNVSQVLGLHLNSPCKFVLLYAQPTFTGVKGGTNTALQVALHNGIPCFNLWEHSVVERMMKFVETGSL